MCFLRIMDILNSLSSLRKCEFDQVQRVYLIPLKKETPRKLCEDNSIFIVRFASLTKNVDNSY